jgi:competence protein ComEC
MPLVGGAVWLGAIAASLIGASAYLLLLVPGITARSRSVRLGHRRLLVALVLAAAAAVTITLLRHDAVRGSPLADLAARRGVADLTATVVSDPRTVEGRAGPQAVVRLRVSELTARGRRLRLGGSVVLVGDPSWADVPLGSRVRARGRLAPADDPDTAALLTDVRRPEVLAAPDVWWRASAAVRASIRAAVADRPPEQAGLVPALVDGDDAGLPAAVEDDFRTTGLTHLTAVSGTNLTLVVGALLLVARMVRVGARGLIVVGLVGIAGFILLARTEPSVLRAAAMGAVGLFAFAHDGRQRGLRALGVAVAGLVLVQPALALTAGFALSVLATGGIVLAGPPLAAGLGRWLPGGLAEAIAVPTAAQLACTPVIALVSGQVSLVAVVANLLAEPLVGPATVLGLLAGVVGLVWPWAGRLLGTTAAWAVAGILEVADRGAALPGAAIGWGSGAVAVGLLAVLCVAAAVALPRLVRRPAVAGGLALVLVLALLGLPGRLWSRSGAWPPSGWVLAACDVGQGDALALSVAPHQAIVIDTGPEPDAVDGCLDRLGVRRVPLLVLTHFHADHVDGLRGALDGRHVDAIEVTPVLDPPGGVALVRETAAAARVPVRLAPYGATRRVGAATLQVLHPDLPGAAPGAGDGSSANDASVVLLVEEAGVRLLLTGDLEPPGQQQVAALVRGLAVDVLKVPHHGSSHQDRAWLTSLRPELALVSVGARNDYGHPSPGLVRELQQAGAEVRRTDRDGDIAVVADGPGRVRVVTGR